MRRLSIVREAILWRNEVAQLAEEHSVRGMFGEQDHYDICKSFLMKGIDESLVQFETILPKGMLVISA